jgi:hypothetical protein
VPTRIGALFQLDRAMVEDAQRAEGWGVRWKRNRDGRVAPKGRTRYFLLQPLLPLIQATLVRGAFGALTPTRPVLTPSKMARLGKRYMPLAQVALSIANKCVHVNTQKWRVILNPLKMKL